MSCPICDRTDVLPLLDLGEAVVFCNVQWATREEALAASRGRLELWACNGCGHVFNRAYDPALVAYAPGYENSQHASTVFGAYAERLTDRLASAYLQAGRPIVDIGCGRGDLLRMLARRAGARGYGFDPSYNAVADGLQDESVRITNEYFDAARARDIRPGLVCCRHVLEHISDPLAFLAGLRDAVAQAGDAVLYLEVPNGSHLFRTGGVWDVIYEHYSYFSPHSLELALRESGFDVLDIYTDFGDQFLCVDARVPRDVDRHRLSELLAAEQPVPLDSAARMAARVTSWKQWAADPARRGRRAAVWGAGSKGVTFLNLVGLGDGPVGTVIDQNPAKEGRFVSGTGQQIVLPSVDVLTDVADIVLMNSIYADEVKAKVRAMNGSAELLLADRQES